MTVLASMLRSALTRAGDRVCLEDPNLRWSIRADQLVAAADNLARDLVPFADRPLLLYLEKSERYYVSLACCFLYSLNFCPVDIGNPMNRLLKIAEQLSNSVIITDDDQIDAELRERGIACFRAPAILRNASFGCTILKDDSIGRYFIATSGSTGTPKLVEVPHDRTIPFVRWAVEFYQVDNRCRWAQFSSIGFDLSLVDFLVVICGGGTLVSLASQIDRLRPGRTIARARITHWHSVPSMIPYFLQETDFERDQGCRVFSFCGEPFLRSHADRLAERYPFARIVNTYGPTEGTLFCSFFEFHSDSLAIEPTLPIGQPIPSWNFVLLSEEEYSRLVIVSKNIANGYVGQQSGCFSTMSLFDQEIPCYDTGDYFRFYRNDLYFSHRRDGMIKINGTRIDLGEIESAADRIGLTNSIAFPKGNSIILAVEGVARPFSKVCEDMAKFVPESYLPKEIVFFESLPRTLNGKLDRTKIVSLIEGRP